MSAVNSLGGESTGKQASVRQRPRDAPWRRNVRLGDGRGSTVGEKRTRRKVFCQPPRGALLRPASSLSPPLRQQRLVR